MKCLSIFLSIYVRLIITLTSHYVIALACTVASPTRASLYVPLRGYLQCINEVRSDQNFYGAAPLWITTLF